MGKGSEYILFQRRHKNIQQAHEFSKKHMNTCSTSSVIRECKSKPYRDATFTSRQWLDFNKCWRGCEEIRTFKH